MIARAPPPFSRLRRLPVGPDVWGHHAAAFAPVTCDNNRPRPSLVCSSRVKSANQPARQSRALHRGVSSDDDAGAPALCTRRVHLAFHPPTHAHTRARGFQSNSQPIPSFYPASTCTGRVELLASPRVVILKRAVTPHRQRPLATVSPSTCCRCCCWWRKRRRWRCRLLLVLRRRQRWGPVHRGAVRILLLLLRRRRRLVVHRRVASHRLRCGHHHQR